MVLMFENDAPTFVDSCSDLDLPPQPIYASLLPLDLIRQAF